MSWTRKYPKKIIDSEKTIENIEQNRPKNN
jgi:hypothetical protein